MDVSQIQIYVILNFIHWMRHGQIFKAIYGYENKNSQRNKKNINEQGVFRFIYIFLRNLCPFRPYVQHKIIFLYNNKNHLEGHFICYFS